MLDRGALTGQGRRFAIAGVVLLCLWLVYGVSRDARALGERLSPIADPFSESNAIRGGLAFLARGITVHAGLPETTFAGLYPEHGDYRRFSGRKRVDTHYPPGPMWLAAGMRTACGERRLSCLRTLPIAVGAVGALALGLALVAALGPLRGLLVAAAAFAVPLYGNMMLGLHYQGYALALLSVELAVLLRAVRSGPALTRREAALLGALGFAQGWLSFDYVFLVALAPLPIAVLFADLRQPAVRRFTLASMAAAGSGFVFAHALHFLQVVAYYGDFTEAVKDLFAVAVERADPALSSARPPPPWAAHPWMMSSLYLFPLSARPDHFGFALGNVLLVALPVLFGLRGRGLLVPGTALRLELDPSTRPGWAVVAAVFVSCAWISVMTGHAHTHPHFIPRHLFLAWLTTLMALACAFRLEHGQSGDA